MGKAIVFAVLLIIVVTWFGLFISWLNNHNRKVSLGLTKSKRDMRAMQREQAAQLSALREIREIAASSVINDSDPMFEVIMHKADEVLESKGSKR